MISLYDLDWIARCSKNLPLKEVKKEETVAETKDPVKHHQTKIAQQTLKIPDAMVGVMGGPNKQQAREFLKKSSTGFTMKGKTKGLGKHKPVVYPSRIDQETEIDGKQIDEAKPRYNVVHEPYSLEKNEVGKSMGVAHFKRFGSKSAAEKELSSRIKTGKTGAGYHYITNPKGEKMALATSRKSRVRYNPMKNEEILQEKNWIQGAIKHPGAEKRAATKAGMSTHAYMEKHKDDSGKSGARARLGLRLSAMRKG